MKKYIGYVIAVVIGGIITAGLGVAAYAYNANNIEYSPSDKTWKVSTVAEAINSLVNDTRGSVMNYSLDEQVVGTWIDGKPIYQKTWTGLNKSVGTGSWITIMSVSSLEIDTLINAYGGKKLQTSVFGMSKIENDNLMVACTDGNSGGIIDTLTLQYTKTTDTGNSNNS